MSERYRSRRTLLKGALAAAVAVTWPHPPRMASAQEARQAQPTPQAPPSPRARQAQPTQQASGARDSDPRAADASASPAPSSATLTTTPIGEQLVLIAGAGANVLARKTGAGLVMVDAGHAEHTTALIAALQQLDDNESVHTLINTHWHAHQIGGNAQIGALGARIVAHAKTRQRLAHGYYLPDQGRYLAPAPSSALPQETVYDSAVLEVGRARIEIGHLLEAHTDGDLFVRFTAENVIAVGDALAPSGDPVLDWWGGGWLGGRADALAALLAISDRDTRFVAGTGDVVGRDAVEAEHALMVELFERATTRLRQGYSAEDMLAAGVLEGLGRTFDDPRAFLDAVHKGLWAHHNTISHDIV